MRKKKHLRFRFGGSIPQPGKKGVGDQETMMEGRNKRLKKQRMGLRMKEIGIPMGLGRRNWDRTRTSEEKSVT